MRRAWEKFLRDPGREDLLLSLVVIVLPCLVLIVGIVAFLRNL